MSTRLSLFFLMLLVPYTLTCSSAQEDASESAPALIDDQGRPSVGFFEHRNQQYNLHDLIDPQFRASHQDPYVREFNPNVFFGIYPSYRSPLELRLGVNRPPRRTVPEVPARVWIERRVLQDEVLISPEPRLDRPDEESQSLEQEP